MRRGGDGPAIRPSAYGVDRSGNQCLVRLQKAHTESITGQNPISLGIDVVVHSGTKYLGGHSHICCGVAVGTRNNAEQIRAVARNLGGSVNAQTAALLERSLMTLAIRVGRQTENAGRIARHLQKQGKVRRVNYPGLESSRYHGLAKSQMTGFGAMLSFELDEAVVRSDDYLRRLKLIRPAVSLGGIETTICSPAETSHAKMSEEERQRVGVTDALGCPSRR